MGHVTLIELLGLISLVVESGVMVRLVHDVHLSAHLAGRPGCLSALVLIMSALVLVSLLLAATPLDLLELVDCLKDVLGAIRVQPHEFGLRLLVLELPLRLLV